MKHTPRWDRCHPSCKFSGYILIYKTNREKVCKSKKRSTGPEGRYVEEVERGGRSLILIAVGWVVSSRHNSGVFVGHSPVLSIPWTNGVTSMLRFT